MTEHTPPGGWDGEAYHRHSAHHRRFDAAFFGRHPPRPDDRVVDLGCGPGAFTAQVAALVPSGTVIGVDPDASMLATARRLVAAPNVTFRRGRAQDLDAVVDPGTADLVISRATFHWIALSDYRRCYEAVRRVLAPGGWFHAESAGTGNVLRLKALMNEVAATHGLAPGTSTYASPGDVYDLLEEVGFDLPDEGVRTVAQRRSFDRDGVYGWIETQGSNAYAAPSAQARAAFLAEIRERLDEVRRHDGSFDQTFVRLQILCQRPE